MVVVIMEGFFIVILGALFMIGFGLVQIATPIEDLWRRQERVLLARGLSPQRNEIWEQKTRIGGWTLVGMGILLFIFSFWFIPSKSKQMSGTSIDGYELTQAEWDACGRNIEACANIYASKIRRN